MQLLASEPLMHCLFRIEYSSQKPNHRSSRDWHA